MAVSSKIQLMVSLPSLILRFPRSFSFVAPEHHCWIADRNRTISAGLCSTGLCCQYWSRADSFRYQSWSGKRLSQAGCQMNHLYGFQYSELLDLFEHWDHIKLQSKYIKYYEMVATDKPSLKRWRSIMSIVRVLVLIVSSVRRWRFAYAAIVDEFVRPHLSYRQWENIRTNLNRCREYHSLYLKELHGQAAKHEKERAQVGRIAKFTRCYCSYVAL